MKVIKSTVLIGWRLPYQTRIPNMQKNKRNAFACATQTYTLQITRWNKSNHRYWLERFAWWISHVENFCRRIPNTTFETIQSTRPHFKPQITKVNVPLPEFIVLVDSVFGYHTYIISKNSRTFGVNSKYQVASVRVSVFFESVKTTFHLNVFFCVGFDFHLTCNTCKVIQSVPLSHRTLVRTRTSPYNSISLRNLSQQTDYNNGSDFSPEIRIVYLLF